MSDQNDNQMTEEQFRSSVLTGVKSIDKRSKETADEVRTIKSEQEVLLENYDQLDKRTKQAMEDLTKAKNELNSVSDVQLALQRLQVQLKREQRMAFADPVQRILGDPDKRERLNAAVRNAVEIRLSEAHKKALGEDTSPGSTIIDDELATDIYDTLERHGSWSSLGVRRMGTKLQKLPVATARPVANFILTEGGTIADDANKAGTQVTLEAEVIAVLLNVSLQLLQDAEVDVAPMILDDFTQAFNYRLDYAVFQGDGTADATHGGVTGIFGGGTAATAATGNTTVETTDFEDWTKCLLTVDAGVLNRACRWWMHQQQLIRALSVKDGNGRPIFLTAVEAPTPGAVGSILGYPVTLVSAAPVANTTSSKIACFGDPQAYAVGIRQDFTFEASDHHKWNTLQRSYRAYGRADGIFRKATGISVLTLAAS